MINIYLMGRACIESVRESLIQGAFLSFVNFFYVFEFFLALLYHFSLVCHFSCLFIIFVVFPSSR
jgi:hypothetical protein